MIKFKIIVFTFIIALLFIPNKVLAMPINIKISNNNIINLELNSSDTIMSVKNKICLRINCSPESIDLKYNTILGNNYTLANYDIQANSTIEVMQIYSITKNNPTNGSINLNKNYASENEKVKLTLNPDIGFKLIKLKYLTIILMLHL